MRYYVIKLRSLRDRRTAFISAKNAEAAWLKLIVYLKTEVEEAGKDWVIEDFKGIK